MVRLKFILCFITAISSTSMAQRLNVGISAGWNLNQRVSTVFEDEPFQFLYAAPYYSEPVDEFDFGSPYDQVRLARVYGVSQDNNACFRFGAGVTYQFKNDLRLNLNYQFFQLRQKIYYGFHNLLLDISDDQNNISSSSPELMDDHISVSKFNSSFSALVIYDIPLKSSIKPFLQAGYTYKLQMFANYTSNLIKDESSILADEDLVSDYYNSRVFQDKLFTEFSNEGFNNYMTIGIGVRRFGLSMAVNWNMALGESKYADYFKNHHFLTLDLQFDVLSIPLFR